MHDNRPQHLAPIPALTAQLPYVSSFVRHDEYRSAFIEDANLLLHSTIRACKTQWQPDLPQLTNALLYLAACGVSLNPVRQEACLLSFYSHKLQRHEITPCIQIRGLVRIASERLPILDIKRQVVVDGDTWHYCETADGPNMTWQPGRERASVASAKDLSNVLGAWCRVTYRDADGSKQTVLGTLVGEELHEKIRANRSANSSYDSPWKNHFLAMLEKTIARYTLMHCLPLWGEPLAALSLASESESDERRLLSQYATSRGLELPPAPAPIHEEHAGAPAQVTLLFDDLHKALSTSRSRAELDAAGARITAARAQLSKEQLAQLTVTCREVMAALKEAGQ